jgi:hypothetical protein
MSQVTFQATIGSDKSTPVEIMAGWDRPLRHYFLNVFLVDAVDDQGSDVWWSTIGNPSDEDSHGTGRLRQQLDSMGITVPEGFWERVERREANVTYAYAEGVWNRD